MMPGDREPPGIEEAGGLPRHAGPRHRRLPSHYHETESHSHRKRLAEVGGGRYAHGWQAGFARGAIDALRMLGRRCCLDCAAEAEQLADYYRGAVDRRTS